MSPFLLEFIDSDFMKGVFYVGAFVVGLVALGIITLLWQLTRAGLRRWRSIRGSAQPVPLSSRLAVVLMVAPAVVLGLAGIFLLGLYMWFEEYESRWYQENAMRVQQHQDSTRVALTGNYFLADTLLGAGDYNSFAATMPPAPVHAHLELRADSTYSYHSNIPNDVTLDTVGTWKLAGYSYDVRFRYERFEVIFTPAWQLRCGLRLFRENNGPVYSRGAYYRDNGYTPFNLTQAKTPD